MLNSVLKDYQDYFLVVLGQASEYLQLIFGLEMKELSLSPPYTTQHTGPVLSIEAKDKIKETLTACQILG